MATKLTMRSMQRICCSIQVAILCLAVLFGATGRASAQVWDAVGPYGGDARSFADNPSAPSHILLGTTNSWIYETNNGRQWTRLSKIADSDSLVVDQILFDKSDPKRVVVGAWMLNGAAGGIFISDDEGHHWKEIQDMRNQSVRALAQAPSDSKVWVAGTLKGVYRSQDDGLHWSLISPMGSSEIHEVESIAIDPLHPQIIYGGKEFHKVQGIPTTARRTRVLKQDPNTPNVIYAGTTEGLYRTANAGVTWTLMTANDVIIN